MPKKYNFSIEEIIMRNPDIIILGYMQKTGSGKDLEVPAKREVSRNRRNKPWALSPDACRYSRTRAEAAGS